MITREKEEDWQYDKEQNKRLVEIINAVNEIAGKEPENIELLRGKESNLDRWQYAKERILLLGKLKAAIGELDFSDTASSSDLSGKLDRNQGEENAGKALVVNEDGDLKPGIDTAQLATTAFVRDAVADAQLAVQTWLPAVNTKVALRDPTVLDHTTSYLCRVIKDPTSDNNGVWQLIAGATDWTYFGNVLKSLEQTHSPKEPYIYCQGNNDLVHPGCL
jgi:hypothetical protein